MAAAERATGPVPQPPTSLYGYVGLVACGRNIPSGTELKKLTGAPGNVAWRTLVPRSALAHLPDVTDATAWWWGEDGHAYFSDVDDESETDSPYFEITVRSYHEPERPGQTVVWSTPATNERVRSRFTV